jgi:hypothetical protein
MSNPKQAVLTEKAPKPIPGVLSQAIIANGTVYCSGQIGLDPTSRKLLEGSIQDRTVRTRKESSRHSFPRGGFRSEMAIDPSNSPGEISP